MLRWSTSSAPSSQNAHEAEELSDGLTSLQSSSLVCARTALALALWCFRSHCSRYNTAYTLTAISIVVPHRLSRARWHSGLATRRLALTTAKLGKSHKHPLQLYPSLQLCLGVDFQVCRWARLQSWKSVGLHACWRGLSWAWYLCQWFSVLLFGFGATRIAERPSIDCHRHHLCISPFGGGKSHSCY